ncbi:MAG: VOC family protein [Dehalococcoidia bacterium]
MAFTLNHLHIKSPDPDSTAQWYIDNLGASRVSDIAGRGVRIDLHGLTVNITGIIDSQNHPQSYGIEHVAINTDDVANVLASIRASGGKVMEEIDGENGRKVCFIEGPDGVCLELIGTS